jgi:hypothetical protein
MISRLVLGREAHAPCSSKGEGEDSPFAGFGGVTTPVDCGIVQMEGEMIAVSTCRIDSEQQRLALSAWVLNGYPPVAHIVADVDDSGEGATSRAGSVRAVLSTLRLWSLSARRIGGV